MYKSKKAFIIFNSLIASLLLTSCSAVTFSSTTSSNQTSESSSSHTSNQTSWNSSSAVTQDSSSHEANSESSSFTSSSEGLTSDSVTSSDDLTSDAVSSSSSDTLTSDSSSSSSSESSSSSSSESSSSSSSSSSQEQEPTYEQLFIDQPSFTHIGQAMKVLGQVERNIPTSMSNEGLTRYPTFGTSLPNITTEEKQAILKEDEVLRASDTTYNSMDKEGNLYLNSVPTGKKLYKHTASENMYYGNVSNDDPAVIKEINIASRPMGNHITGLYAPAGEVIKIEISEEDLKTTGGLTISIGQTSNLNVNNNIWEARNDFCRMPNICNHMQVTTPVSYVGYALGGPIYVTPKNANSQFKVTISGAVEYPHFIYGYTTRSEFEAMKNLSAPFFDFEIWDNAVRHSGPKKFVNMDYDNLTNAANLWMNIVKTSKQVPSGSNTSIGISFLYEPFIAAGAAVAFVGRNFCNLPSDWIHDALDYEAFTSNGAWGQIHEYNHHFQRYGFAPGDEVTNNAINILSYINYTNISSKRSEDDGTLTDWNRYTDPSRSLRETITNSRNSTAQSSLNTYVDIIHTFGVDVFIKATQRYANKGGVDNWYQALVETTNYDMTYYFETMLHQTVSEEIKAKVQAQHLPIFVPVASLYQTGRNYFVDEKEVFIETVKPFQIEYGKEFTIDLEKHLHVPDGFTYQIKSISNPAYGSLKEISNKVYKYTPDLAQQKSGKINVVVTLENNSIQTYDVTLTLEFTQTYAGLNAVKYTYSEQKYKTVNDALANNFAGYESKQELKNYYSTFMNGINPKMFGVIEGKFLIPEDGEYILCFRSDRGNHALYTSINNTNLEERINLTSGNNQFRSDGNHVLHLNVKKGDFVYFKEIITSSSSSDAYMELGWSKITGDQAGDVVSIPSKYLMNTNKEYKDYDFTFEEKYQREYAITSYKANQKIQSIESVNYNPWGSSYKIENIIDGNDNTHFHSQEGKYISSSEPFVLTVNLGEEVLCNALYITGYNRDIRHMPITFKLYGGTSLDNMVLLGDYVNHSFEGRNMVVNFDQAKIRYYRLEITDTDTHEYVALSEVNVGLEINGIEDSLDKATYYNFKTNYDVLGTYGHVIEGDGYLTYSFDGTKFGLMTRQSSYCRLQIEIDGQIFEVELNPSNKKELAYLSSSLINSTHTVKIKVLEGVLSVDSFIYCK